MIRLPYATDAVVEKAIDGYISELHDGSDFKRVSKEIDAVILGVSFAIREALKDMEDGQRIKIDIMVSRCKAK